MDSYVVHSLQTVSNEVEALSAGVQEATRVNKPDLLIIYDEG